MNYDSSMNRHLLSLLATGHRHESMTDASKCNHCGVKFIKAQKEYNRLVKTYPEKFVRKKEVGFTREIENMGDMLEERKKSDVLYQEHLRLLVKGTPEEKKREMARFHSGFYEKHTGRNPKTLIL